MSQLDLSNIINLSALEITPENQSKYTEQISNILTYMDVLKTVTKEPKPEYTWPIHMDALTRDDAPSTFQHDLIEENAPEFSNNSFVVPKILSDS